MSFKIGGSGGSSETQTSIPPWLQSDWEQLLGNANNTFNKMQGQIDSGATKYAGELTPGTNLYSNQGYEQVKDASDDGLGSLYELQPYLDSLAKGQGASAYSPITSQSTRAGQVTRPEDNLFNTWRPDGPRQITSTAQAAAPDASVLNTPTAPSSQIDINKVRDAIAGKGGGAGMADYEDPFLDKVVNTTLQGITDQEQRALNQGNADAATRGASVLTGSRAGVADAETKKAYEQQRAETEAKLRSEGYNTAAGLQQEDLARGLQASTANQNKDLSVGSTNATLGQDLNIENLRDSLQKALTQYGTQADVSKTNAAALNATSGQNATLGQQFDSQLMDQEIQKALDRYNTAFDASKTNAAAETQVGQANADRALQAQQADAAARQSAASTQLAAAGQSAANAGQQMSQRLEGANALIGAGQDLRSTQQARDTAAYQEALRQWGLPIDALNAFAIPFGVQPTTGSGSTTNATSRSSSKGFGA